MTVIERDVVTEARPVTRRDVLHRAADLIEEFGWDKGISGMPNAPYHSGRLCLMGAVLRAHSDLTGEWIPYGSDLTYIVPRGYFNEPAGLMEWNDRRAGSYREVVARLRQAAEDA